MIAARARNAKIVKAIMPKVNPVRRVTVGLRYEIDFLKVSIRIQFRVKAPIVSANATEDEISSKIDLFLSEQRVNTTNAIVKAVKVNASVRIRLVSENVETVSRFQQRMRA